MVQCYFEVYRQGGVCVCVVVSRFKSRAKLKEGITYKSTGKRAQSTKRREPARAKQARASPDASSRLPDLASQLHHIRIRPLQPHSIVV